MTLETFDWLHDLWRLIITSNRLRYTTSTCRDVIQCSRRQHYRWKWLSLSRMSEKRLHMFHKLNENEAIKANLSKQLHIMNLKLTSSTQRWVESNQMEWWPFCGFNDLSIWRPVERWITTITYLIKKKIFSSFRPEWWIEFHSTWLTTLRKTESDRRWACSICGGSVSRLIPKRFESFLWTESFFFFLLFLFSPNRGRYL